MATLLGRHWALPHASRLRRRRRRLVLQTVHSAVADRPFFDQAFTPPRRLGARLVAFRSYAVGKPRRPFELTRRSVFGAQRSRWQWSAVAAVPRERARVHAPTRRAPIAQHAHYRRPVHFSTETEARQQRASPCYSSTGERTAGSGHNEVRPSASKGLLGSAT